jgi:hypothetical protein
MNAFSSVTIVVDSIAALVFLRLIFVVKEDRQSSIVGFIGALFVLAGAILSLCVDNLPHAAVLYIFGFILIFASILPGSRQMFRDMRKLRKLRRSR